MKPVLPCAAVALTALLCAPIAANADNVAPVPGLIVNQCTMGFSQVAIDATKHECRTPFIKCPEHPNGYTAPLKWDSTEAGHRFRYACPFTSGAGRQVFKCATGFSHIIISATQYECRTREINCPKRANVPSFTDPLPWDTSSAGVRFKYRCLYH